MSMHPVAVERLQRRIRKAMNDGLPLMAIDIIGRLCDQKAGNGNHYRHQPQVGGLISVMKRMPDVKYTEREGTYRIEKDEGDEEE